MNIHELKAQMNKMGYGIMAKSLWKDEDLLCDPIIWTNYDLQDTCHNQCKPIDFKKTKEKFNSKIMHDRSVEEGWEIMEIIVQMEL